MTRSGPSASRRNLIVTLAVERITGSCVETYQNDAMRRGTELEDEAIAAYEAHSRELVELVDFIDHQSVPMCGCSPDGLVGDMGLVEVKCPASMAKHADALQDGAHAQEYHWQIQGQLWVSGRCWCDAVSYDPRFPEGLRLAIVRVQRDDKAIADLEASVIKAESEVQDYVARFNKMRQST
jgi:hypothetical protein